MDRRHFLSLSAAGSLALLPATRLLAQNTSSTVTLTLGKPVSERIPEDFTGLSYESAQLSDPEFFKGDNYPLIDLVRRLGRNGVLRIGGNTSEYCFWKQDPGGAGASVPAGQPVGSPDKGNTAPPHRIITEQAVRNLRDFVDATGWSLIYGLNLGGMHMGAGPEMAADEAAYVADVMGDRLIAFQMANEPDLFYRNGLRPASYTAADFIREWRQYFDAVRARVPKAPFAGPDTAFNNDWLVPFAQAFRQDLQFVSSHYYAEGPPSDPRMDIPRLLRPDPKLDREFAGLQQVKRDTGLPFRIAETNSCYGGGKPGVSNTFASALWAADYMFRIVQAGGIGVNFHGGGNGWYTPIAGSRAHGFHAQPIYYGMSIFTCAARLRLLETKLDSQPEGLRVYAMRGGWEERQAGLWIIAMNLHESRPVTVRFTAGPRDRRITVSRLEAASLSATSGIRLGGADLSDVNQSPGATMLNENAAGQPISIDVPPASAAMIHCTS